MKNLFILLSALALASACKKPNIPNSSLTQALNTSLKGSTGSLTMPSIDYQLLFEDHFSGTGSINTTDWYPRPGAYNGNPNLATNVYLQPDSAGNSNLNIDFKFDGALYSGGGIISKHLFGYGYYEVRAKLYSSSYGLHQSFWSYGLNNGYNDPYTKDSLPVQNQIIEIDGFEVDSKTYNNLYSNFHAYIPTKTQIGSQLHSVNTSDWFVMGYEWTPGQVKYYLNDSLVRTINLTGNFDNYAAQNVWITALAGYGVTNTPVAGAKMVVDYFRFYGKKVAEANLVGNSSFEFVKNPQIPMSWREATFSSTYNKDASFIDTTDHYGTTGSNCLKHYLASNYNTTTRQKLEYIPNGYYKLSAWVKSSGGQAKARMEATQFSSTGRYVNIPSSGTWTKIAIDSINVTANKIMLGFTSGASAGQWIKVDSVKLIAL